ncbi:hypothetical protein [Methylogaea oryzae]|uniref:Uncharacterized protein n=1 Tax=Methylogaea oryzae TaxID=1295382 RepID=A0A8D5AL12_9GAMM|nr:hypothetical protein [Methylogaea oryzae]BBL69705.1 hypothetical protein MoryE10_03110 [Methylogaea oryzae]
MNIEQVAAEHTQAFTVANMMDVDRLLAIRTAVNEAIQQGLSLREFRKQVSTLIRATA